MKLTWLIILFSFSTSLIGQIEMKPIPKVSKNQSHRVQSKEFTTLPFWDDFSTSIDLPSELWEFSNSVQISEGLPKNPPTYRAATLDGFDSLGNFYSETETFSGRTDQLISKAIDLSAMAGDESIYLSFFWEAGGNGDLPEDQGDSLRLQLLNQDSVWITTWKTSAPDVTDFENFTQQIFKITTNYRHKDFRFKFETFGSQQGAFDTWHIDYVYMNTGRTSSDIYYSDRAFTGQLESIVNPYREMPAHHFYRDPTKFLMPQTFQASNLEDDQYTLVTEYSLLNEMTDESYHFTFEDVVFLTDETEIKTVNFDIVVTIDPVSLVMDSVMFTNTLYSNFADPKTFGDLAVNDTIRNTLLFHDYYAYDDGTAEFAGGVRNRGSVAIEFALGEQDTLTHIEIYFPKASSSPVGKTLSLNVWDELDGESPLASISHTVEETDLNRLIRVQFTNPVVVKDTIFIGYEQDTNDFLPIGLDRSNLAAKEKIFYLQDGVWLPNEGVNGILMIRPVFRPLGDIVLGNQTMNELSLFPNPSKGLFEINGDYKEVIILSLSGKILLREHPADQHSISSMQSGIYILEVIRRNGNSETFKLIKE